MSYYIMLLYHIILLILFSPGAPSASRPGPRSGRPPRRTPPARMPPCRTPPWGPSAFMPLGCRRGCCHRLRLRAASAAATASAGAAAAGAACYCCCCCYCCGGGCRCWGGPSRRAFELKRILEPKGQRTAGSPRPRRSGHPARQRKREAGSDPRHRRRQQLRGN